MANKHGATAARGSLGGDCTWAAESGTWLGML